MHLSAIAKILEKTQPPELSNKEVTLPYTLTSGPFTGFEAPFACPEANAAHLHRNMIDTYLITHPHLDHIAGFVINTAGLPGTRPKRLAGSPSTIAAFKTHIFNNVIWPNLSDENNGAGLVTYMRLVEGGSPAVGVGESKGYLEITDGLSIKLWGVSHGHCIERHSHRGSSSSSSRYGSLDGPNLTISATATPVLVPTLPGGSLAIPTPRAGSLNHNSATPQPSVVLQQKQQGDQIILATAPQGVLAGSSAPSGPPGRRSSIAPTLPGQPQETICVYDSSAYFIRDVATGTEVLIFGDVEPDSISLSPRNQDIWREAAPKIASGKLAAIFIECSYDDSQTVDRLFGHLAPRFLIQEMANLAEEVRNVQQQRTSQDTATATDSTTPVVVAPGSQADKKKRKRESIGEVPAALLTRRKATQIRPATSAAALSLADDTPISPRTLIPAIARRESSQPFTATSLSLPNPSIAVPTHQQQPPAADPKLQDGDIEMTRQPVTPRSAVQSPPTPFPLRGLKVVIIHVKDKMTDGPKNGEVILKELREYEAETQLGCEFVVSRAGESLYL